MRATLAQDALAVVVMFVIASLGGFLLVRHRQTSQAQHPKVMLDEMRVHVRTGDVLILDARDRSAYAAGHIPTALSFPLAEWKLRAAELNVTLRQHRDRLVVVYCGDSWCGQSEELQLALIDLGHTRVGHFAAGFSAWRDAGLLVALSP